MAVRFLIALAAVSWTLASGTAAALGATPVTWCGSGPSPTDRQPDFEASSANQIHVVYAVPSDGVDRFAELASPIATDVGAIAAWWQRQDGARSPRFDLFQFPGCASTYGMLDLGHLRLPQGAAAYQGADGYPRLATDIGASARGSSKTLAYYDGPRDSARTCGQSFLSPTSGGAAGVALVYLHACTPDLGQGGRTAQTAAHELAHNLGAVASGAPMECPPPNAAHTCDAEHDLMFPFARSAVSLDALVLDLNHDDYYGHGGSWFDVRKSSWLLNLPLYPLTVSVVESGGKGKVTGPGFDCPPTCTGQWENGTRATPNAIPDAGSQLVSWGGACSGVGSCTVSMSSAQSITATFGRANVSLTVRVQGRGRVTSVPPGISCPGRCTGSFPAASAVRLTAAAAKGTRFGGWGGACSGRSRCQVTVDAPLAVRATFTRP